MAEMMVDRGVLAANFVQEFCFHWHRGVFDYGDKYIVFGNDGYAGEDGRVREEVEYVRSRLKALDLKESAFGISDEGGYSWALVIDNYQRFDARIELEQALMEGWRRACGMEGGDNV